jgi:hypothetical protein
MIKRTAVICPGCSAKIRLRISVGLDRVQPFYYVCSRCKAATRGKLLIWYDPSPDSRLELEEGKEVEDSDPVDQVITLHPDLPSKIDAREMYEEGGSPYLFQRALLKDNFLPFYKRLYTFRDTSENDWLKLKRLIGYYVESNWGQFDFEGKKLLGEKWPNPHKDWHRHDLIHRLFDNLFMLLCVNDYYPQMKASWSEIFSPSAYNYNVLLQFARQCIDNGEIRDCQKSIFYCLDVYMDNRSAILPAFPTEFYSKKDWKLHKDLRLMRDEFAQLRDLYVVTFESCHRILKYVIAVINILNRGDPDIFGIKESMTLAKYDKLPNYQKAKMLTMMPVWKKYWPIILDRKLRNAISHSGIYHDLPSGNLVLDNKSKLPYIMFVSKTLNLIHAILISANVLKTIHMIICLEKDN